MRVPFSIAATVILSILTTAEVSFADEMDDILKRGELRVAVQTQGPPVSFVDKHGVRTGLAVELVGMMAKDLGVKLVLQDYDFKGMIPALLSGKVDMIAGNITPTAQRAAQMLFSRPMFYQSTVLVVGKDSAVQSWQEADKAGFTVGATQASTFATAVKMQLPKATLKEFASTPAGAQALTSGRVDGLIGDIGNVTNLVREFGNLRIAEGILNREPLAFGVQANAFHLKMWLDNYVELIEQDRRLEAKVKYWWTSPDWEKDHK